jgi:hypothetical protein
VADATNVWHDVPDWGGIGALRVARPEGCALGASIWELQPGGSGKLAAIVHGEHRYHRTADAAEHAGPE